MNRMEYLRFGVGLLMIAILSSVPAGAQPAAKTDSALRFLYSQRDDLPEKTFPGISRKAGPAGAHVTVRFTRELESADIKDLESAGLVFDRQDGELVRIGRIYSGVLAWDALDRVSSRPDVELIESAWRPKVCHPLNLSVPEINADDVWARTDTQGMPVTGKGVIIADFDSGIDLYHPDFWRADGGEYNWIDTNGNNLFDPGADAVDLNGNSASDANETLRLIDGVLKDAYGTVSNNDNVYQTDLDYLYNDANNNGARDFKTGFNESSPTLGERMFVTRDANNNKQLDAGEKLVALGTSKVKAIRDKNGSVFTRGVNLLQAPGDPGQHGTGVSGVMLGGERGFHRYVGVAPDADLLMADNTGIDNGAFTNFMLWAKNEGAKVMIHEIGIFVFEFLDGSSNYEQAVDTYAAQGIAQVCPSGNLGGGGKHALAALQGGGATFSQTVNVSSQLPTAPKYFIVSCLWRNVNNDMTLVLRHPNGATLNLAGAGNYDSNNFNNHTVWTNRAKSGRGTQRFDVYVLGGTNQVPQNLATGTWSVQLTNNGAAETVHFFSADDISSWGGGVVFGANLSDDGTIDSPATSDKGIAVASYSTRGIVVQAGQLSNFSARGKRIDGVSIQDIAAPGNHDIYTSDSHDTSGVGFGHYWAFGGTSAAGPHVAGVCALLYQAKPAATHDELLSILRQTARSDANTGAVPNELWGAGKIDALAALNALGVGPSRNPGDVNNDGLVNAADSIKVLRHVGGQESLAPADQPFADVDGASGISTGDADRILELSVGN